MIRHARRLWKKLKPRSKYVVFKDKKSGRLLVGKVLTATHYQFLVKADVSGNGAKRFQKIWVGRFNGELIEVFDEDHPPTTLSAR